MVGRAVRLAGAILAVGVLAGCGPAGLASSAVGSLTGGGGDEAQAPVINIYTADHAEREAPAPACEFPRELPVEAPRECKGPPSRDHWDPCMDLLVAALASIEACKAGEFAR